MTGLFMLALLGVVVLIMAGCRESQDITDNTPSAPPTKDAYDV